MKITFQVNTRRDLFLGWLQANGKQAPIPADNGHFDLQQMWPTRSGAAMKAIKVIDGRGGGTGKAYPTGEVIIFDVLALADDRQKVTASCTIPEATRYFAALLIALTDDYPEAKDAILGALEIDLTPAAPVQDQEGGRATGVQLSTVEKLKRLRAERDNSKKGGKIIAKKTALQLVSIDRKTVIRHDPELWAKWEDRDY